MNCERKGDMIDQPLRTACIHGRYDKHEQSIKIAGRVMAEHCPGGREVPIYEVGIIVSRDGGAIKTPYNWTTFKLPDGEYAIFQVERGVNNDRDDPR